MKTESVPNSMEKIIVELMTNLLPSLDLIVREPKNLLKNVLLQLTLVPVITKEIPLLNVKEMKEMPLVTVNKKEKEILPPMENSED